MSKQEVKKGGWRNGEIKVTIPRKTLPYFFGFKRKKKCLDFIDFSKANYNILTK